MDLIFFILSQQIYATHQCNHTENQLNISRLFCIAVLCGDLRPNRSTDFSLWLTPVMPR